MSLEKLPCTDLQEFVADMRFSEVRDEFEKENVGMNEAGELVYFHIDNRRTQIRRYRKNIVLGLDGFEQHSLAEANRLIDQSEGVPPEALDKYFQQATTE